MLFGNECPMYLESLVCWRMLRTTERERVWLNYEPDSENKELADESIESTGLALVGGG